MEKKSLNNTELLVARQLYKALYTKALPHAGEPDLQDIEIASYNISSDLDEFKKTGLGLKVVVIHSTDTGRTQTGHTGKVLMNLPWQVLIEHQHADVEVLPKGSEVPDGYTLLRDAVNDFEGIKEYDPDGTPKTADGEQKYRFRDSEYVIVVSDSEQSKPPQEQVFHFEGKSETFKMIYGDAVLFSDRAQVLSSPVDPNVIPDRFSPEMDRVNATTSRKIYLAPGSEVLLPKHTKHSVLAGAEGAVYLEFSTPSLDEADVFTDERVIR